MTIPTLAALWQRLHAAAPECCALLRGPASTQDLEALRALDLPLPMAFLDSLQMHDGEQDPGALFPFGLQLLSIETLLRLRDEALDTEAEYPDCDELDDDDEPLRAAIGPVRPVVDSRRRLVFLRNEDAEFALDFDPAPGGTPGQVIRCNEAWAVCAPSFESFLLAHAERLEAGLIPDDEGELEDSSFVTGDDEDSAASFLFDGVDELFAVSEDELEEELGDPDELDEEEETEALLAYLAQGKRAVQFWPWLRELPTMQADRLDLAALLNAGRATGEWDRVRELADDARADLSKVERILFDAHAALHEDNPGAGLEALASLSPEALDESVLLLRVELLDANGDVAAALAELSLSIEAGGSARLRARRARLHLQQSGETPYSDSPAKAMQWLGTPAGQQHTAICRDRAVGDLRLALAGEDRIGWRIALGEALIDSERWDEAIALQETLVERLQTRSNEEDPRLQRAREGLRRARARGEDSDDDGSELLAQMDEALGFLREMREELGPDHDPMGRELDELRNTLASMIEHDAQNRAQVEANPDLIDEEAEAVAQQLARQHLDSPERFAPFPDGDIDRPTRRWLDGAQRELESQGFRCLATVEPVRNTEVNGQRVPLRVLLSADTRTVAAVWRLQGPTQAYEVVDLESELENGRILITNNSGAANPFAPPPGLEQIALPLGTAASALFEAHRRRLDVAPSSAVDVPDLDAVLVLQEKQRVIKREHARAEGWVSESDLRNLLGSAYPVLGAQVRSRLALLLG